MVERTYDVSELLLPVGDWSFGDTLMDWPPGKEIAKARMYAMFPETKAEVDARETAAVQWRAKRVEELLGRLKREVAPKSWGPAGPAAVTENAGHLTIVQTPANHRLIAKRIEAWWSQSPRSVQISISARLFLVSTVTGGKLHAWADRQETKAINLKGAWGRWLPAARARGAQARLEADSDCYKPVPLHITGFNEQNVCVQPSLYDHSGRGLEDAIHENAKGSLYARYPEQGLMNVRVRFSRKDADMPAELAISFGRLTRPQPPRKSAKSRTGDEKPPGSLLDRAELPRVKLLIPNGRILVVGMDVKKYHIAADGKGGKELVVRPVATDPRRLYALVSFDVDRAKDRGLSAGGIKPTGATTKPRPGKHKGKSPSLRKSVFERSRLHLAAEKGQLDEVKRLVDAGESVHDIWRLKYFSYGGYSPLYLAAKNGRMDVVRFLLRRGADPSCRRFSGLYGAVEKGDLAIARLLIRHGADLNRAHMKGPHAPLVEAVSRKDMNMIRLLMSEGAKVNQSGAISVAIKAGNRELVEYLLKAAPRADLGRALKTAIDKGEDKLVASLLDRGAMMNDWDTFHTMISLAEDGDRRTMKLLVDHGSDVNTAQYPGGYRPLHKVGSAGAAKLLLELGADVNAKGQYQETPLHEAANSTAGLAKVLLDHGADVNAVCHCGSTPLFKAREPEMVKLLVARGANVRHKDESGWTVLHNICSWKDLNTMKTLVSIGADVNATNDRGLTPICFAAFFGQMDMVKFLLSKGAKLNAVTKQAEETLLAYAAEHKGMLKFLVDKGARVDGTDKYGRTELFRVQLPEDARLLLKRGVDAKARDSSARTALHVVNPDVAKVLLAAGADINATDESGKTPLHYSDYDEKSLRMMVKAGARIEQRDKSGRTPLHQAVLMGPLCTVSGLIKLGAKPNARDNNGCTPLHLIAGGPSNKDRDDIVKEIIEAGADLNARDNRGRTVLHHSIEECFVLMRMIRSGADPGIKDKDGKTVLDLAEQAVAEKKEGVVDNLPALIRKWMKKSR
jgi:ankyrin repeat protein